MIAFFSDLLSLFRRKKQKQSRYITWLRGQVKTAESYWLI